MKISKRQDQIVSQDVPWLQAAHTTDWFREFSWSTDMVLSSEPVHKVLMHELLLRRAAYCHEKAIYISLAFGWVNMSKYIIQLVMDTGDFQEEIDVSKSNTLNV